MIGTLCSINETNIKLITKNEYQVFQKEYIFDQLKGLKYGRAFCERFEIIDPVVSRLIDEDLAKELIESTYIE